MLLALFHQFSVNSCSSPGLQCKSCRLTWVVHWKLLQTFPTWSLSYLHFDVSYKPAVTRESQHYVSTWRLHRDVATVPVIFQPVLLFLQFDQQHSAQTRWAFHLVLIHLTQMEGGRRRTVAAVTVSTHISTHVITCYYSTHTHLLLPDRSPVQDYPAGCAHSPLSPPPGSQRCSCWYLNTLMYQLLR